ncbi:RNA/RNP complex-1-interacting phosphatase isoform X2 [Phlebotomus papatasi]|uniref:RNA/RNP complex-1-interacting phosphatase isoform X2 n=1 Tax=Phlebotomus papatasi TaxID=29031 RepID=UPI0024839C70|nr:RNA/RNP complex-1-interacting phosphatase isoform X2 [Phlebotomus papatasi]
MSHKTSIPDRWLNYSNVGRPIEGSPLIAFKTPLMEKYNKKLHESERFTPDDLVQLVPNIGLIIDLTATNRYYNPLGRVLPDENSVRRFKKVINEFMQDDKNASLLVGVHCTHGVNRTGYMICRYLMDCLKLPADVAIKRFSEARGYDIERHIYINHLRSLNSVRHEDTNWRRVDRRDRHSSSYRSSDRPNYVSYHARRCTEDRNWRISRNYNDPDRLYTSRQSHSSQNWRSQSRQESYNRTWRNPSLDNRRLYRSRERN